jgi:hypothetical protein
LGRSLSLNLLSFGRLHLWALLICAIQPKCWRAFIVLFSGDGDFRSLVEAVQRRGVRVTVISTISSQPPMIADELRRQADVFTDLVKLQSKLSRDPSERPAQREPVESLPNFISK